MPPPRKSDVSLVDADTTIMTDAGADADTSRLAAKDSITIEDLNLPKSILTRLAKGVLPPNTQIQGNAMMAISKSATVFISYLASHANENTMDANKKTIAPADVFKALEDTEFSFLREPLEAEFNKFNTIQTEKRNNYRAKIKATTNPDADDTEMADTSTADAPPAKKARVVGEGAAGADDTEVDDDAHIEDETHIDDDDDEEEEEEQEEEEDDEEGDGEDPDATQDALEEKPQDGDVDEALDGDESD